jgi:rubredoxin
MKKYECTVCGFVYDEAIGDPENGIAPGTKWEDLPQDYTCPLCGVGKEDFQEIHCRCNERYGEGLVLLPYSGTDHKSDRQDSRTRLSGFHS